MSKNGWWSGLLPLALALTLVGAANGVAPAMGSARDDPAAVCAPCASTVIGLAALEDPVGDEEWPGTELGQEEPASPSEPPGSTVEFGPPEIIVPPVMEEGAESGELALQEAAPVEGDVSASIEGSGRIELPEAVVEASPAVQLIQRRVQEAEQELAKLRQTAQEDLVALFTEMVQAMSDDNVAFGNCTIAAAERIGWGSPSMAAETCACMDKMTRWTTLSWVVRAEDLVRTHQRAAFARVAQVYDLAQLVPSAAAETGVLAEVTLIFGPPTEALERFETYAQGEAHRLRERVRADVNALNAGGAANVRTQFEYSRNMWITERAKICPYPPSIPDYPPPTPG